MKTLDLVDNVVTGHSGDPRTGSHDFRDGLMADLQRGPACRVLALAEPVGRDGGRAAHVALQAFKTVVCWSREGDAQALLARGMTGANEAVLELNAAAGFDPRRRRFTGLVAAVVEPERVTIAVAGPCAADLDGIRGCERAACPAEALPLGMSHDVEPVYVQWSCAPTDRLTLTWSDAVLAPPAPSARLATTMAGEVAARETAMVIGTIGELVCAPEELAGADTSSHAATEPPGNGVARSKRSQPGVHERLVDLSERVLAARPDRQDAAATREVALGARSVHRYTGSGQSAGAPGVRARLPRGPRVPVSRKSVAATLTLLLLLAGIGFGYDVRQARAQRQDQLLSDVRAQLELARTAPSADMALSYLNQASVSLDAAAENGARGPLIAKWQRELAVTTDRVHGIRRLEQVERVATLPVNARGATVQLVLIGSDLFAIAGNVYRVDLTGHRLIEELSAGRVIDRQVAGEALAATADGDDLIVFDGTAIFRRNHDTGAWHAAALASPPDGGRWHAAACGSFGGNFYLLDAGAERILKFDGQDLSAAPADWLTPSAQPALQGVMDMVVESSIHVLRQDGLVESLHRGAVSNADALLGTTLGGTPVALFTGRAGDAMMYVAEHEAGRGAVLRVDRASGGATRFMLPDSGVEPATERAFAGLLDIAVDGAAGTLYFVGDGGVWRAELPGVVV